MNINNNANFSFTNISSIFIAYLHHSAQISHVHQKRRVNFESAQDVYTCNTFKLVLPGSYDVYMTHFLYLNPALHIKSRIWVYAPHICCQDFCPEFIAFGCLKALHLFLHFKIHSNRFWHELIKPISIINKVCKTDDTVGGYINLNYLNHSLFPQKHIIRMCLFDEAFPF